MFWSLSGVSCVGPEFTASVFGWGLLFFWGG